MSPRSGWNRRGGAGSTSSSPARQAASHHTASPRFVVTDRTSRAPVVMQVPLATYQAYNAYGGASLYGFNSPDGQATSVRLDRPFDVFDGAGFLYYGDLHLAWWLEREGFDVTYVTSRETHEQPELMERHRVFVTGFHDEYWSLAMRDNLESWLAAGRHALFLSSNNVYWQVDFDTDGEGHPVMRCDKVDGGPQGRFRGNGNPEHRLLGSAYESYRFPYGSAAADWIVTSADHWMYAGTGLRDGESIPRLVGYEWDRLPNDTAGDGVTVVADSPIAGRDERSYRHHACVVEHPGGGIVFNAGTNYWPRLLLGGGHWQPNESVGTITRNLLTRLSAE